MSSAAGGWCGRGDRPRTFKKLKPVICYDSPPTANVNKAHYDDLRHAALMGDVILKTVVPKKSARTWEVKKGDLCRISVIEGSQVGDVNFWNLHNKEERFYSETFLRCAVGAPLPADDLLPGCQTMRSRHIAKIISLYIFQLQMRENILPDIGYWKTRQLHATHLTVYDRLWSCLPYLRPMATVVADSLKGYGIDEDGGSVHDVIGTRCDDYTYKLITGKDRSGSCHTYLTEAVKKVGLSESDVHDVWNIFMCTGFTRDTNKYFAKASPARKGDYIDFIAEMDLLVAMSACPQGDVSVIVGQEVPDELCHPLGVEVFRAKTQSENGES